jgi:hypothetical protein
MRVTILVTTLLATSPGSGDPIYSPPPPPPDSKCYRMTLADWAPPVKAKDVAWIMLPAVIALTPLPAEEDLPDSRRVLPDIDPADPTARMRFATWRTKGEAVEIAWTNGFAGMVLTLFPADKGFRGSGRTVSDVIGELPHRFTVQAKRVECAELAPKSGGRPTMRCSGRGRASHGASPLISVLARQQAD